MNTEKLREESLEISLRSFSEAAGPRRKVSGKGYGEAGRRGGVIAVRRKLSDESRSECWR